MRRPAQFSDDPSRMVIDQPAMGSWRRRSVKGLVILGSVLAFLSVFAIWIDRQALNTDDWVHTSSGMLQNQAIRGAVSDYLVDQLYENVDVEKELKDVLPGVTKELAGGAAVGGEVLARTGAEVALGTSTAQTLWEVANRTAHEELLAVLENKQEAVSTDNGNVSLNLGSLLRNVAEQLGISESTVEELPADAGQIEILHSDELQTAQETVVAIKGLALLLSVLALACFVLAIYLSRQGRWATLLFSGAGLVAAGLAVIALRYVAGRIVIDQLVSDGSAKHAGEAAWSIGTSLMTSIATTVIIIGVLLAAAGWLASPNRAARATRRFIAPTMRQHMAYVYAALAILVGIYFLSSSTQTLRSFLTALVLAAIGAFGIQGLRKRTAEEFPDAKYGDLFGRTKDSVASPVKGANIGEKGVLTDEEFAAEKARVLAGRDV